MLYVLDLAEVPLDQMINKHNKINEYNAFNKYTALNKNRYLNRQKLAKSHL